MIKHLYQLDLSRASTQEGKLELLRRHLAGVDATRRARAADLVSLVETDGPSSQILKALYEVANVTCRDRSERICSSRSPLHGKLLQWPKLVEFLVDFAARDGQVDLETYPEVWVARQVEEEVKEQGDGDEDDDDDEGEAGGARTANPYFRVLTATKSMQLHWSELFKKKFAMSALEEDGFQRSIEHLDDGDLVDRSYVGLTFRTSAIGRALEDEDVGMTKYANFCHVNELSARDFRCYERATDRRRPEGEADVRTIDEVAVVEVLDRALKPVFFER
ncbi:BQ2448_6731 [Microbotryum intermedium]|uniref:BQ2448_6731 protein n=1 Tax=Microbotryum intermedium TaxID=269621 RepID=A0A238FNC8_9BASI|nr:BQ2448_6731 [Microbotryum intermedium]